MIEIFTPDRLILFAVAIAAVVILVLYGVSKFRRRLGGRSRYKLPPSISLKQLGWFGPPENGAQIEIYHIPVRLALVAVAPVGRDAASPTPQQIDSLLESIVPGLPHVLKGHQTTLHIWPAQISKNAFANAFFQKANLPGRGGKGTPWCGVVGKSDGQSGQFLVGILASAKRANGVGQIVVEHSAQWMDIVRVTQSN